MSIVFIIIYHVYATIVLFILTLINAWLVLKSPAYIRNGCVNYPLLEYVVFTDIHAKGVPLSASHC